MAGWVKEDLDQFEKGLALRMVLRYVFLLAFFLYSKPFNISYLHYLENSTCLN